MQSGCILSSMMATAKKFTLMWHTSTPAGWRYFPVILERRDDVMEPKKHGWVMEKGELREYPKGRYVLRSYVEGRKVYTAVPSSNPRDAALAPGRAQRHARAASVTRNPLTAIKTAKELYVRDCQQRGAMEAAKQARAVLDEFLSLPLSCDLLQVRSVTREHVFAFHRALRGRGLSDRTVANKHERLRSWLKFCGADTKFLPPVPKYENKLPTIYTLAEVKAVSYTHLPLARPILPDRPPQHGIPRLQRVQHPPHRHRLPKLKRNLPIQPRQRPQVLRQNHPYRRRSAPFSSPRRGCAFFSHGIVCTSTPVSYTHLDVYKRQDSASELEVAGSPGSEPDR